jgi:glycerol kinase
VGFWKDQDEVKTRWQRDTVFDPAMEEVQRKKLINGWHKAVGRSEQWAASNEQVSCY